MHIVVFGANGRVGSLVTKQLLKNGHTVTACVHKNKQRILTEATIITIDIASKGDVSRALTGADAVVCALSSWGAPKHDILGNAMKILLPAMQESGVKRLISIAGDIAILPGEKPRKIIRIIRSMMVATPKKVIADSDNHIKQIAATNLDWTIIRPSIMTNSSQSRYRFSETHGLSVMIPRVAVIAAIVDLLESGSYIHQAPFITR